MNIFRKSFNYQTMYSNFARDLKSLGFNYSNGKAINSSDDIFTAFQPTRELVKYEAYRFTNIPEKSIKWKYDTSFSSIEQLQHPYFMMDFSPYATNIPGFCINNTGNGYSTKKITTEISLNDQSFRQICFIPLINNGFIFIFYQQSDTGATAYSPNNLLPTPPILTIKDIEEIKQSGVGANTWYYTMLIGVKTNIFKNAPYSYIINTDANDVYSTFDGCDTGCAGKIYSGGCIYPCIILNSQTYYSDPSVFNITTPWVNLMEYTHQQKDVNLQYTDINSHICTLVKVPIFSTYLDNVFMCTTSPFADGVEGKTFSFGGRNFIGMYDNLVLELPRN